jgi:hypothetical protein
MSLPTREQVEREVTAIISTFTSLHPDEIEGGFQLRQPPMLIDHIGLAFLAESLRGYIKQYQPNTTIKAGELRRAGVTVNSVISNIITKLEDLS